MRALGAIEGLYRKAAPLDDIDHFFGPPRVAAPRMARVGTREVKGELFEVLDARWASRIETFAPDVAEPFARDRANHEAAARLFLGPSGAGAPPRPAVILVHGYRAGQYAVEERMWPLDWLLSRGLDVALFVLPFHGVRTRPGGPQRFPGSDPRVTVEGFRQAVDDLRALLRFFTSRGAPRVGAMGMSLGGYTVSLFATVEAELDFVVPMIPLASFADVALAAGRLVGSASEQQDQHAALERAQWTVSPFARPPKVDPSAVVVIGGEGDRITPLSHAEKIAAHFSAELVTFPGGHLLQFGRSAGFRAVGAMLRARGVFRG